MTDRPLISVVVPTYNRAALLPRALDSIIAQTFTDWEIVLIDDGSTDHTPEVIASYKRRLGDRLMHLQQPNLGVNHARNRGIESCRGSFVGFLDSDDEFLPTKLERQLALFEHCPDLGLVYGDYSFIDLNGVHSESAFDACMPLAREVEFEEIAPRLCVCTGSLFDSLLRGYFVATIVGMVRREVLGESIRFPTHCRYSEEWLFYLRVSRACRAGFVNEPLCLHHFTDGSITRTDKHRNRVRFGRLLETIYAEFDELSPQNRKVIQKQLALNKRQLGFDALRGRDGMDAFRYFSSSLSYEPRFEDLYRMAHAALMIATGVKPTRWDSEAPIQDATPAVR